MKKLWKDRHGSGIIPAFGVALILLLFSCACMEYFRLQSIAAYVRDALQSAVVETCTEQYADLYAGVREGYSGGYKCSEGDWEENLSAADIYGRLNTGLGMETDGDGVVKYTGSDKNFRLSGLSAQITNAPFAPDGENTKQLTCKAEIDLEVPLMFRWNEVPPLRTHLTVTAGYIPKF